MFQQTAGSAARTAPFTSPEVDALPHDPGFVEQLFTPGNTRVRGPAHERVTLCQDPDTGLKAVIAVHSTVLGPALGGTRFHAYSGEAEAVVDSLNLSRGMTYKNALAGIPYGGGKAVVLGDPEELKTPELLHAFGRLVGSFDGSYVTACDVGTESADMDIIAEETAHVVGRSPAAGGLGDPSVLTAQGVLQGMRACARERWGESRLLGRRIGVNGLGKVGHQLAGLLVQAGATVVATDPRHEALLRTKEQHPQVHVLADPESLLDQDLEIFSPCALGGALDEATVRRLSAPVVCGSANNQLASPGTGEELNRRGILYAPDYVVNAGGVIHAAQEHADAPLHQAVEQAHRKTERIYDTTLEIFTAAARSRSSTAAVADALAEQRLADAAAGEPNFSGGSVQGVRR